MFLYCTELVLEQFW